MKNLLLELKQILQQATLIESVPEQMQRIVTGIGQVTGIDVCILYRRIKDGDLSLLASYGLSFGQTIVVPAGKGLVGMVVDSRRPLIIRKPAEHPHYLLIPGVNERAYQSFCGVPLVYSGRVVGAMVVQSVSEAAINEETEALLVTLASQLALMVMVSEPQHQQEQTNNNLKLNGLKGSPGIGIGKVRICYQDSLNDVPDTECDDISRTIGQWHELLDNVQSDLRDEKASLTPELGDNVQAIFQAYQMILMDPALIERIESEIRAGYSLPSALRRGIHYFAEFFDSMEDSYLKSRSDDIHQLGNKLFNRWLGENRPSLMVEGDERVVLAGSQVSVSEMAAVAMPNLAGIICQTGSTLSHTAVLANALGIPAVMGIGSLRELQPCDQAIVDGNAGQVIVRPTKAVLKEYNQLLHQEQRFRQELDSLHDQPAITRDGTIINLMTNTGLLADITPGLKSGAEGIGLYRTEIPFLIRESFPSEDEQVEIYRSVLESYANKPVYMRTLDIGNDKQLPYFTMDAEENPALGWRGIRFTLDNVHLLMIQVRAMLRAAEGLNNLHVLLPMVTSTSELMAFEQLLDDACEQLRLEGRAIERPKTGIMVEVPAAISQLPLWKDRIDFISIGSNDLSQYLLAVDRNNGRVACHHDSVHPAVLHELHRIVTFARSCELPVSLCGEMAADPVAVVLLLGMGVRKLSLSSAVLPRTKWLIRALTISLAEKALQQALSLDSPETIRTLVEQELASLGLKEVAR